MRSDDCKDIRVLGYCCVSQVFYSDAVVLGNGLLKVVESRPAKFVAGHLRLYLGYVQCHGAGKAAGKAFQACIQHGAKITRVEGVRG